MTFLLIFLIIIISFIFMLMFRNNEVYKYLIKLNEEVSKKCKEDINNNKDWRWRYDELDKISYLEIVWKFWKPVDSFYDKDNLLK